MKLKTKQARTLPDPGRQDIAMTLYRLLPVLFLACAGPSASEYQRGTSVTRPPPAPVRPGVGAPVVGQPGTVVAPLPRSPNVRPLPPSSEMGLWSADGPRAARKSEPPVVFDFTMPVPDIESAVIRGYSQLCAASVDDTTRFQVIDEAIKRLSKHEQECLAIRAYKSCIHTLKDWLATQPEPKRTQHAGGLTKHWQHVGRVSGTRCNDVDFMSPDMLSLQSSIAVVSSSTLSAWLNSE